MEDTLQHKETAQCVGLGVVHNLGSNFASCLFLAGYCGHGTASMMSRLAASAKVVAYLAGPLAAYWMIERVAGFLRSRQLKGIVTLI